MIVPGIQNFTGYIGSTFDTLITVYPSSNSNLTWTGQWIQTQNYSIGQVAIGTDNNAYNALKANINVNPIGDLTGNWSTPLPPLNLNNWSGYITISPNAIDELIVAPYLSTPVQVQGLQGTIYIRIAPTQSTTPLIPPGTYHHYLTMTDPSGNVYYYLNGSFTWLSP